MTARLKPATVQARVSSLRKIAEQFRDLTDPLNGPGGVKGDGGSIQVMPHERHCLLVTVEGDQREQGVRCTCAYQCVQEFAALMAAMRDDRSRPLIPVASERVSVRKLRWHIDAWYVDARRAVRHYPAPMRKGKPVKRLKDQEILQGPDGRWIPTLVNEQVVRDPSARRDLADAGLEVLARSWRLDREPMLPIDLLVAA